MRIEPTIWAFPGSRIMVPSGSKSQKELPGHLILLHGIFSVSTLTYTELFSPQPTVPPYKALEQYRSRTKDPLLHGLSHPDHGVQSLHLAFTEM